MKKFKTKKKHRFIKLLFILIIIYIFFKITLSILYKNVIDPSKYISYLVSEGINFNISNNDYFNSITKPIAMIENSLSFLVDKNINNNMVEFIEKVNSKVDTKLVYIYNTHENEEYKKEFKSDYSILPNVKIASYVLQECLNNNGINSYVEVNSIKKILDDNNWIYKDSYKASRLLLENNKDYKYYIDIHRDSSSFDKTTLNINGVMYAKIMFVVGLEYDSYEYNLNIASKLSDMLNKKIDGISKGVLKKDGIGVNGIYNQDFSPNLLLIEIGGVDNDILEVSNSVKVLASVLMEYIKEDNK